MEMFQFKLKDRFETYSTTPKGGVLDCTHEASGIKARQIPTYKLGSVRALGVSVQKC